MKNKVSLFLFSLILILSLGSFERVFACTCGKASACERYGFADVIFIGQAVDIERIEGKKDKNGKEVGWATESTVFKIEEMILGSRKREIKVRNKSGFSCDVEFNQNETYLIFAGGNEKEGYGTNFCAGNLPVKYAREMLDELRSLPQAGAGGKLFGNIRDSLRKTSEERVPMPDIQVKIQESGRKGRIYHAVTDRVGNYEVNVPEGKYKIFPSVPAYAVLDSFADTDELFVKDRACTEQSFSMRNKSLVTGRVVDFHGKPLPEDFRIEFFPVGQERKPWSSADEGGRVEGSNGVFKFESVPAGKYTMSVNYLHSPEASSPFQPVFYPNAATRSSAQVFEIGLGQTVSGIVFRLPPPLAKKKIYGSVVWADGKIAAGVDVHLEDSESPGMCVNGCFQKTDLSGNFILEGYGNRTYRAKASARKLFAGRNAWYKAASSLFSAGDVLPNFKLTLLKEEDPVNKDTDANYSSMNRP